jgi:hypothetical protein
MTEEPIVIDAFNGSDTGDFSGAGDVEPIGYPQRRVSKAA